jgi:crotonobetainyl-CoA:carnitine CoA-transferase CaiB-like acyl-CoA transferase
MKLPLEGITVLDLTRMLPGGYSSTVLADLGAEVIMVENPKYQLNLQNLPPFFKKGETKVSAFNSVLGRNKKSITLNLKHEKGREVFYKLVENADVVIDTFRPKVVDRLKIDYKTLSNINKSIICCSLSGFGQNGPYEQIAGHDLNYIGICGLLGANIGNNNPKPIVPSVQTGDLGGALYFVIGILSAIMARDKDPEKRGQFVDVSMFESAFAFMPQPLMYQFTKDYMNVEEDSGGLLSGGSPFYSIYETKDSKYMAVGAIEWKFRLKVCECLGREDLKAKAGEVGKDRTILFEEFEKEFLKKTQKEWFEIFKNEDACVTPVNSVSEACKNPQILAREMIVTQNHPKLGAIKNVALPIKMSRTQPSIRTFAPELGEQNEEILKSLNYTDDQISHFKDKGII